MIRHEPYSQTKKKIKSIENGSWGIELPFSETQGQTPSGAEET